MVVIRLARGGAKKRPFYRVVAADKRMPRDGRFIEQIGTFDPRVEKGSIKLSMDRVEHWIKVGAQPSDTVKGLIKKFKSLAPAAV
ncbi:MAG TPA: 30S ribosomal protein S16 [Myxococcota bacterium]|nr:30S ribosomal protein S16 [Myxococcota bacterium]